MENFLSLKDLSILLSVQGELGKIGWDPSVSKSNR